MDANTINEAEYEAISAAWDAKVAQEEANEGERILAEFEAYLYDWLNYRDPEPDPDFQTIGGV